MSKEVENSMVNSLLPGQQKKAKQAKDKAAQDAYYTRSYPSYGRSYGDDYEYTSYSGRSSSYYHRPTYSTAVSSANPIKTIMDNAVSAYKDNDKLTHITITPSEMDKIIDTLTKEMGKTLDTASIVWTSQYVLAIRKALEDMLTNAVYEFYNTTIGSDDYIPIAVAGISPASVQPHAGHISAVDDKFDPMTGEVLVDDNDIDLSLTTLTDYKGRTLVMRGGDRWIIDKVELSLNRCYTFYTHQILSDGSRDEEEWDYDEFGAYWTSVNRDHPSDIVDIELATVPPTTVEDINLDSHTPSKYIGATLHLANGDMLEVVTCSETASANYTFELLDNNHLIIMDYTHKGVSLDNKFEHDIINITFLE